MKGVLKIKFLKKYIPILFTAFAFLFININDVKASTLIKSENIIFEHSENKSISSTLWTTYYSNVNVEATHIAINPNDLDLKENKYIAMTVKDGDAIRLNNITYHSTEIYNSINYDIFTLGHSYIEDLRLTNRTGSSLTINSVILLNDFSKKIENITNLIYDINNNELTFNYDLPDNENFSHLELHQDGSLLADNIVTNNFEVTNLEYDTKYNFTFYSVDKNGIKSTGISREILLPENPALIPSNNIFNLNHSVSDTTVSFNYNLPSDPNFSHLKIYRNNELINDNYQLSEFTDINLTPETEYNYRFVSVNKMDISNAGYSITVKTMIENDTTPPAVPTGLNAKAMNSGIILSWNSNNETDLKGYNIYLNGTKLNRNPISNTIYNVTNLENGNEYNFTVSAVDNFDNESEQSSVVSSVPDVDKLPIFKLDTSLSSVGNSIENWFSEIWVIVAFATSIPLAFLIAQRVKYLFIA